MTVTPWDRHVALDRDPADAHATDHAREQKPADAPRSAAEAAEQEQARQVAEGTESPG